MLVFGFFVCLFLMRLGFILSFLVLFFPPTYSNGQSTLVGVLAGHKYYTGTSAFFHKETEGVERFGQTYFSYAC